MSQNRLRRREDIKRALKRAGDDAEMLLEDLAAMWGVTKARFVTVRNGMPGFPEPKRVDGSIFIYAARPALQAMWDWETRNDKIKSDRRARQNKLLGKGRGRPSKADLEEPMFTPTELLRFDQLAASVEQREINQGKLVWQADVEAVFSEIFSMLSSTVGSLANTCDPNGLLAPDVRSAIDNAGRQVLLNLHSEMKSYLSGKNGKSRRTPKD